MDVLTLDSIFEQTINGQTKAAQTMKQRLANWRMRRLQHAQRTRLMFDEMQVLFTNTNSSMSEVVTGYSDEFGQPRLVVSAITDLVGQLVRFSDTITNKGWSPEPVPIRVYAGKKGSTRGHQRFAPQIVPATARIVGDFRNPPWPSVGGGPFYYGFGNTVFLCYWIAPAAPPATQQELDALKVAEQAIKDGEPPQQITLSGTIKVTQDAADEVYKFETKPFGKALLITGLTLNVPNAINARVSISDSSTNQAWMKKRILMWGVAGDSFNSDAPILELPKAYYLPAGAVLRGEFENTTDGTTARAVPKEYTFSYVGETP